MTPSLHCAIYTRKSSEEGLEQGFNSLHAQREACESYILSQAGEGWSALTDVYDDGGFSGGSLQRPGIQGLLTDIRRGLIDIVVVYKVDRLTRALGDFARMVELFDEHKVSFVSVTQAFNTTTSMGRLTLNVLLSFAQFEREVTGERIRDKIAASKAKGMWMGGRPPLGYDGVDRRLAVNAAEAVAVRHIFTRYLELGSVIALERELRDDGIHSKQWINGKGEPAGGNPLARGALYHLLANPVYLGSLRHREKIIPGCHPAIIDEAQFKAVADMLASTAGKRPSSPRRAAEVLLRGLLVDDAGSPMAPVHTTKDSTRYRYYALTRPAAGRPAGSLTRIAMGVLDAFVIDQVQPLMARGWMSEEPLEARVRAALNRVTCGEDRIVLNLRAEAIVAEPSARHPDIRTTDAGYELGVSIRLKHRRGATLIEAARSVERPPRLDKSLIRAVCLARAWATRLASGETASIRNLAVDQGLCSHYTSRLMPLAWLAPDLVTLILEGRQPQSMGLGALTRLVLPLDWDQQRRLFSA